MIEHKKICGIASLLHISRLADDPKLLISQAIPAGTLLAMCMAMEAGIAALLGAAKLATSTVN